MHGELTKLGAAIVRNTRRARFFIASKIPLLALFVLAARGFNNA